MTVDDIDVDATLEKIRQVGGDATLEVEGNAWSQRRLLAAHCQRLNIVPVMVGELDDC